MSVAESANIINTKMENGYATILKVSIIRIGLVIMTAALNMKVGNNGLFYK